MPTPVATLRASLEKHNDAFESLLKLIPAKYYLFQEESEEQVFLLFRIIFSFSNPDSSSWHQSTKNTRKKERRTSK
jgi:hypothetical protein